jgi:hypothetical protein
MRFCRGFFLSGNHLGRSDAANTRTSPPESGLCSFWLDGPKGCAGARKSRTMRGKTVKHFTIAMIALLIPATDLAAGECRKDRHKFCRGATDIRACLYAHESELSDACKAMREARAGARKNAEQSGKMGKEEGNAQTGAQPLTRQDCKTAGMKWNDQANVCG